MTTPDRFNEKYVSKSAGVLKKLSWNLRTMMVYADVLETAIAELKMQPHELLVADLPVQQVANVAMTINLNSTKALGINVPLCR